MVIFTWIDNRHLQIFYLFHRCTDSILLQDFFHIFGTSKNNSLDQYATFDACYDLKRSWFQNFSTICFKIKFPLFHFQVIFIANGPTVKTVKYKRMNHFANLSTQICKILISESKDKKFRFPTYMRKRSWCNCYHRRKWKR